MTTGNKPIDPKARAEDMRAKHEARKADHQKARAGTEKARLENQIKHQQDLIDRFKKQQDELKARLNALG